MTQVLPGWSQPDNFRKAPHQRLVDKVNETAGVTPPDGQDYYRTPKGSGLVDLRQSRYVEGVVWVRPTAKAGRPGVYTGSVWAVDASAFNPEDTGTWAAADLGAAEDDEIVIVNLMEEGLDTWVLIDGATSDDGANADLPPQLFPAAYADTLADGRELYLISGFKWKPCGE
jgi:hypothetical protein